MPDDYVETIRTMVQHEDGLRDQRLGWLFALNGLLFTALGFLWDDKSSLDLIYVLSGLGVTVSLSSLGALYANERAVRYLRGLGDAKRGADQPPIVGGRTPGPEWCKFLVRMSYPWRAAPVLLAVAWILVAVFARGR